MHRLPWFVGGLESEWVCMNTLVYMSDFDLELLDVQFCVHIIHSIKDNPPHPHFCPSQMATIATATASALLS